MFIKKITPSLQESLEREGFKEPTPFQKLLLSKVNSGKNIIGISPDNSGKTIAILIAALHTIKEAFEKAPRAVIVVSDDNKVLEFQQHFEKISRYTDLRIDGITEKGNISDQIDWIFEGTDLVVGTPQRLHKIYLRNGLNLNQLLLFAIDDTDLILRKQKNIQLINRLFTGLPRCQKIICCKDYTSKIESLTGEFLPFPEIVSF